VNVSELKCNGRFGFTAELIYCSIDYLVVFISCFFPAIIGAILSSEALFLFCFFSLRGWGAAKISHPIVLSEAVWFFGLGLFPVAVEMGQVYFFLQKLCWMGGMRMGGYVEFVFYGLFRADKRRKQSKK
jgi:hypothetical protein